MDLIGDFSTFLRARIRIRQLNFFYWLIEKVMDSTQKVCFSEGIDRCFNSFFFFALIKVFHCKLPNCHSMRGKHPTKATAQSNDGKMFFMKRWIAVVPAKDVQVDISHFINLFGIKSRKEEIVEPVQASGYVNVEK